MDVMVGERSSVTVLSMSHDEHADPLRNVGDVKDSCQTQDEETKLKLRYIHLG